MAKAIAIKAIYLVVVIAMIVSFTVIGLTNYIPSILGTITQAHCASKASNYCDECKQGQCPNWDEFAPGCTEIGIDAPTLEECGISVVLEDCSSECGNRGFATGTCRKTTTIPIDGKMTHGVMHCPGDAYLDKMWDDSAGEFTNKFKRQIDQVADAGIDLFYLTFHSASNEGGFWEGDKSNLGSQCEVIDRSRANPFTGQLTGRCERFFDETIPYILGKDMKVTLYMWLRGGDSFWRWLGRDSNSINKVEDYIIPFWKSLTQYLKEKNYPYDKVILGPVFGNVGSGWGWPGYYEQEAVDWWTPIMKKVVDEIHSVDPNRIVIASPMSDFGGGPTLCEDPPHEGRWLPVGPAETVWYRVMTSKTQGGNTDTCNSDYDTNPSENEDYPIDDGEICLDWFQKEHGATVVTEELKPFGGYVKGHFCPDWDWEIRSPEAYNWLDDWLVKRDELELGWMWENANCFRTGIGEAFYNGDGSEKPFVDNIRNYLESSTSSTSSSSFNPDTDIVFEYGAEDDTIGTMPKPPFSHAGRSGSCDAGDPSPDGYARVDDTHARTGTKSIKYYQPPPDSKCNADRRISCRVYGGDHDQTELYVSYHLYVDTSIYTSVPTSDNWINLGGIKNRYGPEGTGEESQRRNGFVLQIDPKTKEFFIKHYWLYCKVQGAKYNVDYDEYHTGLYATDYANKWVHLEFYFKLSSTPTKVYEVFINGISKWSYTGISDPTTDSRWTRDEYIWDRRGWNPDGKPYVSVSIYTGTSQPECRMWVDDVVLATEYVPSNYGVGEPYEDGGGELLFKSGFENGVYLEDPIVSGGQWFHYLRGEDEGYVWPDDLPHRKSARFQYKVDSSVPQGSIKEYAQSRIDTVTGYDDETTRALYMEVTKDDPTQSNIVRNQYNMYSWDGPEEMYARYWIKLQPNLRDVMVDPNDPNSDGWRMVMEWKEIDSSGDFDYHFAFYILIDNNGPMYWHTHGTMGGYGNDAEYRDWEYDSSGPDPESILGEWALLEVYWKHHETDGRLWIAVNGQTVCDHNGRTKRNSQLYGWEPFKVYTGTKQHGYGKHYQWIDNVEFWDGIPSGDGEDDDGGATPQYPPTKIWGDDSYWYMKIKSNPTLHPDNDEMIDWLMDNHADYPGIQWRSWTNVVYDAYEGTPVYSVYNEGDNQNNNIPFPDPYPVQIPEESDHAVTIIDWYRGKVWDTWNVRAQDGGYVAGDAYPFELYGSGMGVLGGEWTCGGSGTPSVAYLIRPEEIEAGVINHPIGCALRATGPYEGGSRYSMAKGFVHPPSVHTDRKVSKDYNPYEIPEGARIQLDPAIDLDSLGLSETGKIIAKAMQDYGIVAAEAGGSWHIYAEHDFTADWNPPQMSGELLSPIASLVTPSYNPWRIVDFELYPTIDDMSEYELSVTDEACLPDETPITDTCGAGEICCCSGVLPAKSCDEECRDNGFASGVCTSGATETSTLGNTNVESNTWGEKNQIRAYKFIAPKTGTLESMSIYISCPSIGEIKYFRLGIYDDNSGKPDNLLAQTDKIVRHKDDPWMWVQGDLQQNVQVVQGNAYWLSYFGTCPNLKIKTGEGSANHLARKGYTFNGFPSQFGTPDSMGSTIMSIYATYTDTSNDGGCQSEETSIGQDGCDPGELCCCSGTAPPPSGEFSINKHIVIWGGWDPSNSDLQFVASHFDIVNVQPEKGFTKADALELKRLNPDITILMYLDAVGAAGIPESKLYESDYLHDTDGGRLKSKTYGFQIRDPSSQHWRQLWAERALQVIDEYGIDGIFADDVWSTLWDGRFYTTPKQSDKDNWYSNMKGFLTYVKGQLGDYLLIPNTHDNGDYVDITDGKWEEDFVHARWASYGNFPSTIDWKKKIDGVKTVCQKGKIELVSGGCSQLEGDKSWTDSHSSEVKNLLEFTFSSYLLGASGTKSAFNFGTYWNRDDSDGYYSIFDDAKQLGDPVSDYGEFGSVYARDFENGKVLVNPSSSTYTISLGGDYETLDDQTVSSITMGPHTGEILLKTI